MAIHAVVLIVFLLAPLFAPLRAPAFPSGLAPFVVSMAAVPEIAVPRPRPPVAVEAAQGGHPADVGARGRADLGQVARALDLEREQRVLDLAVLPLET